MIRIIEGLVSDKWDELDKLLPLHVSELTTRKDLMVLNPDKNKYKIAEDNGAVLALFVYDDDKLIGYSVNLFTNHIHYKDLYYVHNDVLFLLEEYRNSKLGKLIIAETEILAKEKGAKFIVMHAKENSAFSKLLPTIGYSVQDIMYGKEL